jgi:hypothetical protein
LKLCIQDLQEYGIILHLFAVESHQGVKISVVDRIHPDTDPDSSGYGSGSGILSESGSGYGSGSGSRVLVTQKKIQVKNFLYIFFDQKLQFTNP